MNGSSSPMLTIRHQLPNHSQPAPRFPITQQSLHNTYIRFHVLRSKLFSISLQTTLLQEKANVVKLDKPRSSVSDTKKIIVSEG